MLLTLATTTMLLVLAEVEVVTTTLVAAVKPGETTVKSEGKPTPVTESPTAMLPVLPTTFFNNISSLVAFIATSALTGE